MKLEKPIAWKVKNLAGTAYQRGLISKADEERVDRVANRKLHGVKEYELEHWGD